MSVDRELLALAAKAAGIRISSWHFERARVETGRFNGHEPECLFWSPLYDDGDALRLAVKLDMQLGSNGAGEIDGVSWAESGCISYASHPHDGDPLSATRRAIVLAAAAIGRLP